MPELRVVLFDLGGTLIYFDGEWPAVFQRAGRSLIQSLAASGLNLDEREFLPALRERLDAYYDQREAEFIEYTTTYVLRGLLRDWGYPDPPSPVIRRALDAMYAVSQARWKREKDTLTTLETIQDRDFRLGLISNAGDDADVQALVDRAEIRPYFDVILTSAAQGIRKPNPHIFHQALSHWGEPPEQAVMVGDTLGADVLGAHNAGLYSVWITRRADTPANRAHMDTIRPDATIGALTELPPLLETFPVHSAGGRTGSDHSAR